MSCRPTPTAQYKTSVPCPQCFVPRYEGHGHPLEREIRRYHHCELEDQYAPGGPPMPYQPLPRRGSTNTAGGQSASTFVCGLEDPSAPGQGPAASQPVSHSEVTNPTRNQMNNTSTRDPIREGLSTLRIRSGRAISRALASPSRRVEESAIARLQRAYFVDSEPTGEESKIQANKRIFRVLGETTADLRRAGINTRLQPSAFRSSDTPQTDAEKVAIEKILQGMGMTGGSFTAVVKAAEDVDVQELVDKE